MAKLTGRRIGITAAKRKERKEYKDYKQYKKYYPLLRYRESFVKFEKREKEKPPVSHALSKN